MNQDSIKKENRKALKIYIPFLAACCIIGGMVGYFGFRSGAEEAADRLQRFVSELLYGVAPYGVILAVLIPLVWSIFNYRKAKGLYDAAEKTEDEDTFDLLFDEAEKKMALSMAVLGIGTVAGLMFFGVTLSQLERHITERSLLYVITIGVFIAGNFITVRMNQLQVDLIKKMNPEKRGSVYDIKFHQKWEESCDEAEKLTIYRAAYKAFRRTSVACSLGWTVLCLGTFLFDYGALPVVVVSAIWMNMIISYYRETLRLERGKLNE